LKRSGHQGAQVSSKWGYRYTGGWQRTAAVHEVKEHSLSHLTTQWAQTKALLGPWLRTLHIHSLTPDSPALDDQPLLDRLWQLRGTGLTIGASVSGPRQAEVIDRLLTVRRQGERLFSAVQATWNLLERSAGPALQRAHDAGLQVVVKEGLANGRLSPRGDVTPVLDEAQRRGTTADALSLAVALAQPFADVVLSGAATKTQVAANLLARNVEVLADTLTSVTQPAERYWAERSTLRWS
jgi:aryl-alcohol dehydrogenase-like predicted oxidoreductase